MSGPIYIFAGGGTGGHLYPGLAVAEQLRKRHCDAKIIFACSNRAIDRRVLDPTPYAIVPQPVQPLPRSVAGGWRFLRAWQNSKRQSRQMIADLQPVAVLGLGGFAAAPIVGQAARRKIPAALLNPDAVPGKANQHLARHVDTIFTQFPATTESFSPAIRQKIHCVGCPVAQKIIQADRREAIAFFGLQADCKTLLILGGSLGATTINQAFQALGDELTPLAGTWQVLHITGPTQVVVVRPKGIHAVQLEYCGRMDLAYAAADVALCRGGAATVAELAATALPAVILPYPYHKDNHQRWNAAGLVAAGSAEIVEDCIDTAANAQGLRGTLLPILTDSSRLETMKTHAAQSARVDAAGHVAEWLATQAAF